MYDHHKCELLLKTTPEKKINNISNKRFKSKICEEFLQINKNDPRGTNKQMLEQMLFKREHERG